MQYCSSLLWLGLLSVDLFTTQQLRSKLWSPVANLLSPALRAGTIAATGATASRATCEVTVQFNILIQGTPEASPPGTMLGFFGRAIHIEAPLSFTGPLPLTYQAQPLSDCPGEGTGAPCGRDQTSPARPAHGRPSPNLF